MQKDSKIIISIVSAIAAVAIVLLSFMGIHYLFGNPAGWIFATDMRTFTVVAGGDYSQNQIADYMRAMHKSGQAYTQISDRLYCAAAENGYENIDAMMAEKGWQFIGTDGNLVTMRCYYKDGKAVWARIEFDINGVWSLWNFGTQFDYNVETDGYKTMQ